MLECMCIIHKPGIFSGDCYLESSTLEVCVTSCDFIVQETWLVHSEEESGDEGVWCAGQRSPPGTPLSSENEEMK